MLVNKDKNQQGCNKIWTRLGFPAVVLHTVLKAGGRGRGGAELRKVLLERVVGLGLGHLGSFGTNFMVQPSNPLRLAVFFLGSSDVGFFSDGHYMFYIFLLFICCSAEAALPIQALL